jgi:8-oxo-dGTP pyrophosphatase MutT (NUDIX family)
VPEPDQPASGGTGAVLSVGVDELPNWWSTLVSRLPDVQGEHISRFLPPPDGSGRPSAVLILLADREGGRPPDDPIGADVLLLERAANMRSHAGQPAFPGGATDPGDDGPVDTALREAQEEVGLDPSTVEVVGSLPPLWLPPSNFVVTPVLGWWRRPHPVGPADPAEVARVARVPVTDLANPANRVRVRHPSGFNGPAFEVSDLLVWGFTAGLLSFVLDLGGWSTPWDTTKVRELPAIDVERARRTRPPDAVH